MACLLDDETPGFDLIEVPSEDPFVLFNQWYKEVGETDLVMPGAFTFATVNKDGQTSARSLLMRRLDSDGFVFTTHRNGRKAQDLALQPSGAMVFFWGYMKNGDRIFRQVRVEGGVTSIPSEECLVLYDKEPLYCKMRAHLCPQGKPVEWQEQQDSYIQLLGNIRNSGHQLTMPEEFVGYKLTADVMDFYLCTNNKIADRLLFERRVEDNSWSYQRIAP